MPDYRDRAERQKGIALRNTRGAALKITSAVLRNAAKNPDAAVEDAKLPRGAAPMYLHMAQEITKDVIRTEAEQSQQGTTILNVVITGVAETREQWLEAVAHSKAIDAVVAESEPKP